MRYYDARKSEYIDKYRYRVYLTESIRNAARGAYLTHSYLDIIEDRVQRDTRSGEEVAMDVIKKHGLKVEA